MQALINRHETLRTSFDMADGEVVQTIHKMCRSSLKPPSREEDAEELTKAFIR